MNFKAYYAQLSSKAQQFVDNLDQANNKKGLESLTKQFLSLDGNEIKFIEEMFRQAGDDANYLMDVLPNWREIIQQKDNQTSLSIQEELKQRGFIDTVINEINDELESKRQELRKHKNYLLNVRQDFSEVLIRRAFMKTNKSDVMLPAQEAQLIHGYHLQKDLYSN